MIRAFTIGNTTLLLLLIASCGKSKMLIGTDDPHNQQSVEFELQPLQGDQDSRQWIGTYASQGKVAKFRIEFGPATDSNPKEPGVKFGEGRFVPENGSDASVLLADLGKALQAKSAHTPASTKTDVPITFGIIGENRSQSASGLFVTEPSGDWTVTKIILGDENHEGQVFLNLNSKTGKGRFTIKDPNDGDRVLQELAKVL